jgi:hypothetical protein
MKRFTMNMTLAVAAMALAAGTISAQTMKAEIPFAFRVGNQTMQPGEYRVNLVSGFSGATVVRMANYDLHKSVLAMPDHRTDTKNAWAAAGRPVLQFDCSGAQCSLSNVWMGEGATLAFSTERGKNGEPRIAEITMRPERAAD